MRIDATNKHFKVLNDEIRTGGSDIVIDHCLGQRYLVSGMKNKTVEINGIPGNALGAYLDDCHIIVNGNAQDAVGDTMNHGKIVIHGNCGDAPGYAMRGGKIFIRGNAGYRAGIHMKAYMDKKPVLVIGGKAGSFLGEYQAGGIIIVLGMNCDGIPVGDFAATGQHGGAIYVCSDWPPQNLPRHAMVSKCSKEDFEEITPILQEYAEDMNLEFGDLMQHQMWVIRPDTSNLYQAMYARNSV